MSKPRKKPAKSVFNAQLGNMLRTIRLTCGYSQKVIASTLCLERSSYSNYELGQTSPALDSLRTLAKLYAIPVEAFLHPEEFLDLETTRRCPPRKVRLDPQSIGDLSASERQVIARLRAQDKSG